MAGRRAGPYVVRYVTVVDRPQRREAGQPSVPAGARISTERKAGRRSEALAIFEAILAGTYDGASEYVDRVQVMRLEAGGPAWVRKPVKRRRTNGVTSSGAEKRRRAPLVTSGPRPQPSPPPPAAPPPPPKTPEGRLEFVDLATGEPRAPAEPGTAATGRVVVDVEGASVPVDPEDLIGFGAPPDPRKRRYSVDLEGPTDYRAQARRKGAAKRKRPKPIRRPRVAGLRATFKSTSEAARIFYDENASFFDHVRDPIDGLRSWADGVDVRTGRKTSRRLSKTAAGRAIFGARMGEPQIKAALRWVFAQAEGRRWDRVPWREISGLEDALEPYFEAPTSGAESATRGLVWRPNIGPVDAKTLDALPSNVRQRVRDYEAHVEIKEALSELKDAYRRTSECIPAPLRRTALHRIKAWSSWAKAPSEIPGYACEPDPTTGGHTCNYPVIAGELRALRRACDDAYDPDWPRTEAARGAAGFPDVSLGEQDTTPRPRPAVLAPDPKPPKPAFRKVAKLAKPAKKKEKPRSVAIGQLTGARVDRLENVGYAFATGKTASALRGEVAGLISVGKLRQLDERGIAVVPMKLTKKQADRLKTERSRISSLHQGLIEVRSQIAKGSLHTPTTLGDAEKLQGGASEMVRRTGRLLATAKAQEDRLDYDARGKSPRAKLLQHHSLWEPIRKNLKDAEEMARDATTLYEAATRHVAAKTKAATKRKPKAPEKKPAERRAPAKAPRAKPAKPAPARKATVKECASMLGKRGAAARKKKRELSEQEKRRILEDALAVAIS